MKKIYFTPGPTALFYTVEEHIKKALKLQIPSISHRSDTFKKVYEEVSENLKTLLKLPDNYQFGFTASATEIWARQIENFVSKSSYHITNGAFSERSYNVAKALNKSTIQQKVEDGHSFDFNSLNIPDETELICLAHNETSTGVATPLEDIYALKRINPDKLVSVDVVSSLPVVDLDFNQVDSAFCSVQKAFGLPAGLGIWFYNEASIEKARLVKSHGRHTSYHNLQSLSDYHKQNQTPSTPNVLNIYLLGEVVKDMLNKGMEAIRRESKQKAALIYYLFESHNQLSAFVKRGNIRSETVGVANVEGNAQKIIEELNNKGLVIGSGYGNYKNSQVRIANFPTHSKEQIELLVDTFHAL